MKQINAWMAVACLVLIPACAAKQPDPLENTRKLVREGHASLYNNGAFRVPRSSICLIPPAPETTELIMELAGLRARQAFLRSLKQASESVYIVSEGTRLTFRAAGTARDTGRDTAEYIRRHAREGAVLLLDRTWDGGRDLVGESWRFSGQVADGVAAAAEALDDDGARLGQRLDAAGSARRLALIREARAAAATLYNDRVEGAKDSLATARSRFVKGYLAVPENLGRNLDAAGDHLDEASFSRILAHENRRRKKASDKAVNLIVGTAAGYADDVRGTLARAGDEWEGVYTTGLPLTSLKVFRWVLQGLFWDAVIEPAAKMTAGGLGYIGVNGLAFPVMVVEEEGRALARIAVDVSWNASRSVYDVTAPSAEAALAAIYGVLEYGAGPVSAGAVLAGGHLAGGAGLAAANVGGMVVSGTGKAAGVAGRYIGVPLAAAGVAVTGTTAGLAVMSGGAVTSGAVVAGGEVAAGGSDLFGNVIAGTTLVTGTAASLGGGGAYGVYQLSKAVMVPSGYELGAGLVLSYETLSQLGAQSILAVSDCAYLVLSLEGPRWVLYAVKGTVDQGDDPAPGTVLDLDAMHRQGEEIYNLPVSDDEMKHVVSSACQHLPLLGNTPSENIP
ncbi:hypothetical protein JCM14469_22690 [Desulfatiferula olefinivorans]